MRKCLLSLLIFATTSVFATISQVRSSATWSSSASSSCNVTLSATNTGDLIGIWTYWKTSAANNLTASVGDSLGKTYLSAVGPTVQSVSNTASQIFYLPNVGSNPSGYTVTVTFSGSASVASGCVAVEYSGADIYYPLDSVSAGYSTAGNKTGLLDSGTVAPASSNLLVFAGGTSDNTTGLAAGSGFSSIQTNSGISGSSIVEANTAAISSNNVLQRSTATLTPALTTGNWVMQEAIFRDASSTVTGAWSPTRTSATRYAEQFPGATADLKINAAIADLPSGGGIVDATGFGCGSQTIAGAVTVGGVGKPVKLILNPCTQYHVTASIGSAQDVIQIGAGSAVVEQGNSGGTVSLGSNANFIVAPGANFQCMFAPADRTGGQETWFLDGVNIIGDYVTRGVSGAGIYSQGLVCVEGGGTNSRVSNVYTSNCWGPSALFITSSYGRSGTGNGRTTGDTQFFNNNWDCTGSATVATVNITTPTAYSAYNQISNLNFFGDNIQHSCCVDNASSSPYNANAPLLLMCVESTSNLCVTDTNIAIKTINFWGSYFEGFSSSISNIIDAARLENTLDVHVNSGSMQAGVFTNAFHLIQNNGDFSLGGFYTTSASDSVLYSPTGETAGTFVQSWSTNGDLSAASAATNRLSSLTVKGNLTVTGTCTGCAAPVPAQVGYVSCTQTTPCAGTATTIYTSGSSTALYNLSGAVACSIATPTATVQISVNYTDPSGTVQTISPAAAVCTTLGSGSVAAINQSVQILNGTNVQYAVTTTSTPSYQARVAVLQLGLN